MILLNTGRFKQGQRRPVKSSSQSMLSSFLCFVLFKYLIPIRMVDKEEELLRLPSAKQREED